MADLKLVNHVHQINPEKPERIYCKREQKLIKCDFTECEHCPYFGNAIPDGEGGTLVCKWEDVSTEGYVNKEYFPDDEQNELFRTSSLIDNKVIKKG